MKIVLVSHCNFLGNSAMHVFSLAEELTRLGHDVVMLVPDGVETVDRHRVANFSIRLYDDALSKPLPFADGGPADIVHAWTPREHVRKLTVALSEREGCPFILHMEDNEEQIVSDEMRNVSFTELCELPELYQDVLTSPYRSHPTRYRQFAEAAAGYTCLIDRLLEFKPAGTPGTVFWPGFDPEFETLPASRQLLRREHGIADDEIMLFYSGNVHHSVVSDVRNLYLAVAILRTRGRKVRLLRTGWNYADMGLDGDDDIAAASIELGFVDREKMPGLLAICDLLVQPGRSDTFNDYRFPSKLTEFLVSGKPVVLPDSNIAHALEDEVEVLKLREGTLAELIVTIERLLDEPAVARRLGQGSRAFALDNLRWNKAAMKLAALYEEVLGAAAPVERADDDNVEEAVAEHPVKLITFYLPQFHPIAENNEWWGAGFTEWTNVSRAKAQMFAHRQPRRPADLGYYDLRLVDTMHEQAALARRYGVGGFCFYAYWFEGRRLLERPLELWLESGPDFPFCLSWANENWSRRWDGSEAEILIDQDYDEGFEERFIIDMLPYLIDRRYIRVGGAPMLLIYRITEFPDPAASVLALRQAAEKHGIPELHLVATQSFGIGDPRPYGCNAAVEFSPHHFDRRLLDPQRVGGVSPGFEGHVEDYVGVAAQGINARPTDYARYRGCFPMWDNTARRGARGHVFINDSPKAYGHWLRFLVHEAMLRKDHVEPLVFINAWNEWAEGAYLEPDDVYGHALLEITRESLAHGVADFALGGSTPERNRDFTLKVSRLPQLR